MDRAVKKEVKKTRPTYICMYLPEAVAKSGLAEARRRGMSRSQHYSWLLSRELKRRAA